MKPGVRKFLFLVVMTLTATVAQAQIHCSELPPLTVDGVYPRCSSRELAVAGYPDHMHAYNWYSWEVLTDADGLTYGPGALCLQKEVVPRDGLVVEPDRKAYRQMSLSHNPGYADCDMIQFLELLDWANQAVPDLLGLAAQDTLFILNPDNSEQYTELTGQGVWRFYALDGDRAVMQPFPVLMARTLAGHGAFMLVTDWILRENFGDDLPPWLRQGIVEYIGEDGTHLANYMAEFRAKGPILMAPALVDGLLARDTDLDSGNDREMFRRACYSSFLMVWHLVENEGGLTALREFLDLAAQGTDLDQASVSVYGMDLGQLAVYLDPVKIGEPVPETIERQSPHAQP